MSEFKKDLPTIVYGTAWKEERTAELVKIAVREGFKGLDTANQPKHYQEKLMGEALLELSADGILRDALFIQTKFTPADGQDHRVPYNPQEDLTTQVNTSFKSSLRNLHTDYLDSYLLHGPYSRFGLNDSDREVWRAFENLYRSGGVKRIGISNVSSTQLTTLLEEASVKPMVVQNRCFAIHGWDSDVRRICREHGIVYQGFSLLTANGFVVRAPQVQKIGHRLGITPAQVIFVFAMQIGMMPLTGTTDREHMNQDLNAMDVRLTDDEVTVIESIGLD